jgi:hypothetical protein
MKLWQIGYPIALIEIIFKNKNNEEKEKIKQEINAILDTNYFLYRDYPVNFMGGIFLSGNKIIELEIIENTLWNIVKFLHDKEIIWDPSSITIMATEYRNNNAKNRIGYLRVTGTSITTFLIDQNGKVDETSFVLPVPKDKI